MRLRSSLSIIGLAFLILYFGMVGFLEIHDEYSTEIAVTLYSEYKLKERVNHADYGGQSTTLLFTDSDLKEYPIILELIQENLKKEIPKNRHAKITVSYDELLSIHQYMAIKYAEKYDTSPDDYIKINDKRERGHPYYHSFEAEIFTIDGKLYGFGRHTFEIIDFDKVELGVHTQKMNYWIRDWEIADLTSEDIKNIPKLGLVINETEKYDMNVQSRKGMVESEFYEYRDWAKSLGLVDKSNHSIGNSFIEYDGKIYHIYFRDI